MSLDWLLNPATQYSLIGLVLLGSLVLWISFRKELQSVRANAAQSHDFVDATVKTLSEHVDEIRETIQNQPWVTPPSPVPPGVNSARRAQALLLHLRGEPAENVAAAVNVPKNEIELLLKLNRLLHVENS